MGRRIIDSKGPKGRSYVSCQEGINPLWSSSPSKQFIYVYIRIRNGNNDKFLYTWCTFATFDSYHRCRERNTTKHDQHLRKLLIRTLLQAVHNVVRVHVYIIDSDRVNLQIVNLLSQLLQRCACCRFISDIAKTYQFQQIHSTVDNSSSGPLSKISL